MGRPQTETADGVITNQVGTSARVGGESLPWLRGPMNVPVERLNHGSSMQVGWATGTLLDFSIIFGKLSSAEQERIRAQVRREAERISNDGVVRSVGVFSAPKKPDVYMLAVGDSNDPNRLTALVTRGTWMKDPIVYLVAGGKMDDLRRLERALGPDYKPTKKLQPIHGRRR